MVAGGWLGRFVGGLFIAGRARAFAQYTVPDLLEVRYSPIARVLGTLCIIVSYTAIVSYQFRGGGRIGNLAFGVSERTGTFILAGFVILFTALAGMSSVAYTDVAIGLLVTAGLHHCLAGDASARRRVDRNARCVASESLHV